MIYVNGFYKLHLNMKFNKYLSVNTLIEIVKTSVDAIIVIDNSGLIQYVNQATLFLFLYPKEDLIGQNISILMPQPDKAGHDGYIKKYEDTGKRTIIGIGREVVAQKKNGDKFSCLLSLSEVNSDNQKYYTGIIHDISALKEAEANLKELNTSLEQKVSERTEKLSEVVNRLLTTNNELTQEINLREKAESALKKSEEDLRLSLNKEKELSILKSRFVTMASHEFRTPLSTILSSTNLISKYLELGNTEKLANHALKIKEHVNHLTGILNDFLSLGKWEEGKVSVEITKFSWAPFLEDLKENLTGILKEQEIVLSYEQGVITSDINLLKNSLINLISNAIKYSDTGKKVWVKSYFRDEYFVIEVKDEGQGIPSADIPHIFERFFRASNALNIEGTGIGLNLVKAYVSEINGEVSFVTEEGVGSTFILTLPQD
jgi:PAS domain S-box-containing protein